MSGMIPQILKTRKSFNFMASSLLAYYFSTKWLHTESKKERLALRLIREASKDLGLEFESKSSGWIMLITDPKTSQTKYIYGYSFGLNPQSVAMICDDKPALSEVLETKKIPHIKHRIFLHPGLSNWSTSSGMFSDLFSYAEAHQWDLVLKPKDGSGGQHVFRCKNKRELEAAALTILSHGYTLAASPYKKIEAEYRVIILDGKSRLIFRKDRPSLLGDGSKTLRELLLEDFKKDPLSKLDFLIRSTNNLKEIDLNKVPENGALTPIIWKHNLAGGALASIKIDPLIEEKLNLLAIEAVTALGAVLFLWILLD